MLQSQSKVIIFYIGQEEYGLNIDNIISIERFTSVRKLSITSEYILGVTDIRGKVTPVVDLRESNIKNNDNLVESSRIIVVNIVDKQIGLLVDSATDILDLSEKSIQKPIIGEENQDFVEGIVKVGERLVVILKTNQLLKNVRGLNEVLNSVAV